MTIPPGGTVDLPVVASATSTAPTGDDTGFVVFTRGSDRVRVPYYFTVSYPQLGRAPRDTIKVDQLGDTSKGTNYVSGYRFPTEPFGPPPSYTGQPFNEDGAEQVYTVRVSEHVANAGTAVIASAPDALVEPWFLGSLNEDDVQGYPGTPVNVNGLTFEYQFDNQTAAVDFPHEGRYFVAVDSRADPYTNLPLKGEYLLHSWQNDVTPPRFKLLTKVVTPGPAADRGGRQRPRRGRRPALAGDRLQADAAARLALRPGLRAGAAGARRRAGDQGGQDADAGDRLRLPGVEEHRPGREHPPELRLPRLQLRAVTRPTVTWLLPRPLACTDKVEGLFVIAGASHGVRSVKFFDGKRRISTQRRGGEGLFGAQWRTRKAHAGRHVLRALVTDRRGATAAATRVVRVCR